MPKRNWQLSEWALLPLRAYLGFTFLYAGMQKLANPNFFNAKSPISIQQQLIASARLSPLHAMLKHLEGGAKAVGIFMALAEIAVALGTLLGFWTRIAAIGGAVISFSLFLTVSFHSSPFFTGADILFFFAWMPFILAGDSTRFSLAGWVARTVTKKSPLSNDLVAIPFSTVQGICGHFDGGKCGALQGATCGEAVCPWLEDQTSPHITPIDVASIKRRTLITGAAVGTGTLVLGLFTSDTGRMINDAQSPTSSTSLSSGATSSGDNKIIGKASKVAVGTAATFTLPNGDPGIVVHTKTGLWEAYDAVCPHMGCTVGYYASSDEFVCPCHGSTFNLTTGAVLGGPAPHGLTKYTVTEDASGNLTIQ
jgi:thiosulfate dehydrogenase [quinone] large subunit